MRGLLPTSFAVFATAVAYANAELSASSAQSINLWRLLGSGSTEKHQQLYHAEHSQAVLIDNEQLTKEFLEQWFKQPLDHFSNDTHTFQQRFWFNAKHYKEGGPVFVLDGGETSGEDHLPFLHTGILEILSKATNGLGVVLEHRYYGKSIPAANFSTDSLRWLNNAQSAADSAKFMSEVKFAGIDSDLTAPGTPWIYYGGSYAGARSAHMRVLYPDLVFGAIASSAVTHATIELWEYYDIIRQAADPDCSKHLQTSIHVIDGILLTAPHFKRPLKALFGLAELKHDDDFGALLSRPLGAWQAKNWDPAVGSSRFTEFCDALAQPFLGKQPLEGQLLPGGLELPVVVLNYARWVRENFVDRCPPTETVEDCFGTHDDFKFQNTSISETWRAWLFQVCTEWGYFQTAPPRGHPRIVSVFMTLESESRICKQAFPPGKHFTVPVWPNVTAVNALGDFAISAHRLALIDGEVDPWRPATPHSEYAPPRKDSIEQPFKLIPDGVHHFDENGLTNMNEEPFEILNIHKEEIAFVKEWLKEWNDLH